MEVSWNESGSSSLWFSMEGREFELNSGNGNIIEDIFTGLSALYFRGCIKLSVQFCIGQLLGDSDLPHRIVAKIIPLASLEAICQSSLTTQTLMAFLQVCKCMYPKLQVQASNLTSFKNVENIEVPASAIWSLLLFSELFGVHKLHEECVNKLCKMFRRDDEPKLPVSVTSELSSKNLKEVETNLQTYFSNHVAPEANRNGVYDTTASASIPVSTEPATVSSRKTTNMHRYVSGNPERTTGITTSVYAPTCSTHNREDALYQEYFNGYSDINQKVIDEQAASRTIRAQLRAPPISSLLSTPVAVPEIRRNPHEEYHDYHVSIVGTPSSFSAHKHQQQQQQQQELQWRQNQHDCVYPQHISLLPGNAQQGKPSSPLEITDYGYSSAEEVGSEDSFGEDDRYTHREGALRRKRSEMKGCSPSAMRRHTTTVCSSHQQQTASARPSSPGFGSTVRRFVTPFAEPPSIPRSTAAPITPTSYKTSHISTSSSRLRRSGSGGGRSRPDSSAVKALQSSQSTSSSHSGLSGSPQTDFEYDSDNYAMNNTSSHSVHHHQARAALTPEDLRISREIAKLRLQEVKVKEELEASKQRAEREMRETRLRSLELKAAVARTAGHSATLRNSQEALLAQNTRLNASADKRAGSAVAEKATPAAVAAHQGYVAEEARIRAVQRVKEARRVQERKEALQQAQAKVREEQKWALRDKKIELFKEKQRTVFGNVQLSEEDKETSEGVSVQWLRGSLPGTSTTHLPPPPPPNIAVPKTPRAVQSLRGSVSASKDRYSVASLRNDTDDSPAGTDDELQTHNTIVKSGLYSTEALEAVGMGLSPGSSSALIPKSASSVPPSPIGLSSATDIVSAKILRAWGLPESLGGTSAYVVADWGKYGKSATQAVAHTTEPHFGATLQFRSPYTALRPADRAAVQEDASIALLRTPGGAEYVSFAGPLKVMVYNRNQSVSDELLACGEVDVHEYLTNSGDNAGETAVLYLVDTNFRPAGCLEYTVKYSMK